MDGKKKWLWLLGAFAAGYVLSNKLDTVPGFSKLPKL